MRSRSTILTCLVVGLLAGSLAQGQTMEEAVRRYEQGDFDTAFAWFSKRAALDDAAATYYLGRMNERGESVSRDYEAAARFYLAAADAEVPEAQFALGSLYEFGMGVRRDPVEAKLWYTKAAAQGHEGAVRALNPAAAPATNRPAIASASRANTGSNGQVLPKLGAKREANASWEFVSEVKDTLYPSLILISSSLRLPEGPKDPALIGDPTGLLGIKIQAPHDQASVRFEIEGDRFVKKSVYETRLPKQGQTYTVFPHLSYDYEALLRNRQPIPEVLKARVFLRGQPAGERTIRLTIASLNDCLYGRKSGAARASMNWMFAAYVNENHPAIEPLMKEALDRKLVTAFMGYQQKSANLMAELNAIWTLLKERGIKYSSITTPSVDSSDYQVQHVRLFSEAMKNTQANCVDGTTLLASIFLRMALRPFLILQPGHMYLGLAVEDDGPPALFLETTVLGSATLEEALASGAASFAKGGKQFADPNNSKFEIVDVMACRAMGVLPLKEVEHD